jgi:hypothetical protein
MPLRRRPVVTAAAVHHGASQSARDDEAGYVSYEALATG